MRQILVAREKDVFTETLSANGFSVVNFPTIKTETIADLTEFENFINEIETFDGIFITSSKAAEIISAKLSETGKDYNGKFYVLGKRSRDLLKKSGCKIFFSENITTAKELLDAIPKGELKNKRFLFPCGNRSLRVVPETLENIAEVVETIVYKTTEIQGDSAKLLEIKEKLDEEKIEAICFFSPSGVAEFLKKFEDFKQDKIKIAAIGRTTAGFAKENDLRVDFISAKPGARDFADELMKYLRKAI